MSEERLTKKERVAQKREEKEAKKHAAEKKAKMQKMIFATVVVLIVVGIVALARMAQPNVDEVLDLDPDPTAGIKDSAVVVKEYADFQCPACAGVHPVVEDIIEEYGDYITYTYNDFPLPQHELAGYAAVAGECLTRQDDAFFFEFASQAFGQQRSWTTQSEEEAQDTFRAFAEETGANMTQFDACVVTEDASDAVERDITEARALNVNATPTFFVNGVRVVEAPYSITLRQAIEEALEEAGVEIEVEPVEEEVEETTEVEEEATEETTEESAEESVE